MFEQIYSTILKDQPEVLTVPEVARIMRMGRNKVYSLINNGRISSIKIGGKIIVPKIYLIDFLVDIKNCQIFPDSSPVIAGL